MSAPRILITGAAGFIGGAAVRALAARGCEVTGVDIVAASDLPVRRWFDGGIANGALPADALAGVSAVLHAAWLGYPGTRVAVETELGHNLADTVDLYRRAREAGVARYVFLSSGGTVYGEPARMPIAEETPLAPISLYGAAKGAAELFLRSLAHLGGPELVVLRLANPFGPGQLPWRGQGVVPTAIACALTGMPFTIWGATAAERDYLYIDDVADALVRALLGGVPGGVYNVGSGIGRSLADCLDAIERVTGRAIARAPAPGRGVDVTHNVLDPRAFAGACGWRATVAFEDGIAMHRDWLVANPDRWSPPPM